MRSVTEFINKTPDIAHPFNRRIQENTVRFQENDDKANQNDFDIAHPSTSRIQENSVKFQENHNE